MNSCTLGDNGIRSRDFGDKAGHAYILRSVCVCLLPRHGGASSSLLNPKVLKRLAKHSAALPGLLSDPGPASFLVSHPQRHP